MDTTGLTVALAAARERRRALAPLLADSDIYRLFHGAAEGRPGLAVDRFGPLMLVQTFREPLSAHELAAIDAAWAGEPGLVHRVYNHRGPDPVDPAISPPSPEANDVHVARELGIRYRIAARHTGADPWLFPDLRAARRWVLAHASGLRVLNVFAYTCGVGLAALAGGASEVLNVDVSARHLELGLANLRENSALDAARFRTLAADALCVLPQLGGRPIKGWAARRSYPRLAPDAFDLVVLDPPTRAVGPFGAVDIVRDYPSLLVPALRATREGGRILATHHHADRTASEWQRTLERAAAKAGRPLRGTQAIVPEGDFPSFDGQPPLKMVVLDV